MEECVGVRRLLTAAVVVALFLAVPVFADDKPGSQLSEPQTLSAQIADFVIAHGTPVSVNVGLANEGTRYEMRFYFDHELYEVRVWASNAGEKSFEISYYLTNQDFSSFSHPSDPVAHELIWGRPKIFIEDHLTDFGIDDNIDAYQEFAKKQDLGSGRYLLDGFTRDERDMGEKAGIQEFFFDGGAVMLPGPKRDATDEELNEIRADYREHLTRLAKHLNIK